MRTLVISIAFAVAAVLLIPAVNAAETRKDRLKSIYEAEDHRLSQAPVFAHMESLRRPSELEAALTALGRIGDVAAVPRVVPFLHDRNARIRIAGATALGFIGGPSAVSALTSALATETHTSVLGIELLSLARAGGEPELATVTAALPRVSQNHLALANAIEGIGVLLNKNSAKWNVSTSLLLMLTERATSTEPVSTAAAFALTRYKGDVANLPADALIRAFANSETSARALLARVLGKLKHEKALAALIAGYKPGDTIGVRTETARALANYPDAPAALAALAGALRDSNPGVRIQALQSIASIGPKAVSIQSAIEGAIANSSESVKAQVVQTLAAVGPNAARSIAIKFLNDKNPGLIAAALATLGVLGSDADVAQILAFIGNPSTRIAGAAIAAVGTVPKATVPPSALTAMRQVLMKHDLGLTAVVADTATSLEWYELAPDLAAAYQKLESADDVEAKLGILGALAKIGTKDQLSIVEFALKDDERLVVEAAANAYKAITTIDVSSRIPSTSRIRSQLPRMNDIDRATRTRVLLHTTKGDIKIELLDTAPLVAYNFVTLVQNGFYDGKTFHRVVPNFVAQGGDPRGDGYGGPGYLIRDQVSSLRHARGTLGMATAGKDTAGSQFFINLAPNYHLNGNYTVFAYVMSGMGAADRLEAGDVITRAEVE